MTADSAYGELSDKFGPNCVFGAPASAFTTYKAGGAARALVKPGSAQEFSWLNRWCAANKLPLRVLGRGSNVLVSDKGLDGVTVLTEKLSSITFSGPAVTAEAGASWDDLCREACERGLAGFEKASGIPGSVGGALRMNAGAFGQEAFDKLVEAEVMRPDGSTVRLAKEKLPHGYRSAAGLDGLIVLSAVFELPRAPKEELLAERARILACRAEKQPLDLPSAGSVFKRPPGDYASRLIDAAGLKGLRLGGALVSPKHAGFIVNAGGATASDIYSLMLKVRAEVLAKTGVRLELEQLLLGEFPEDKAAAQV